MTWLFLVFVAFPLPRPVEMPRPSGGYEIKRVSPLSHWRHV